MFQRHSQLAAQYLSRVSGYSSAGVQANIAVSPWEGMTYNAMAVH